MRPALLYLSAATALFLALLATNPARADASSRIVYVSPSGRDSGPGTLWRPWQSLEQTIARAPAGATIVVLPGKYPTVKVTRAFRRTINVYGVVSHGARPTVDGIEIWGGRRIAFRGLRITGPARITSHPTRKWRQPAKHITFENDEFTVPGHVCLSIRAFARWINVARNYIHGCTYGIGGANTTGQPSSHISISRNVIDHLTADGIQFAWWKHVSITDNLIEYVRDPRHIVHNDGIQFVGASSYVTIARNLIRHSAQLLFVQPAVGRISHVTIEDNLLYDARDYAVQIQGSRRVRFVHNTVWRSRYGGLLVRQGTMPRGRILVPHDTIVAHNVLSGYGTTGGARAAYFGHNLLAHPTRAQGVHNVVGKPRFAAAAHGDFRIVHPRLRGVGVRYSQVGWHPTHPAGSLLRAARLPARSLPVKVKGLFAHRH